MFAQLASNQEQTAHLQGMARHLDTVCMISSEDQDTLVTIRQGRVTDVRTGPFVMPSYDFRLIAPRREWEAFLQPVPEPGSHDLLALLRRGVLRFEGNLHPLMSHLLFFKLLLASLRHKEDTR